MYRAQWRVLLPDNRLDGPIIMTNKKFSAIGACRRAGMKSRPSLGGITKWNDYRQSEFSGTPKQIAKVVAEAKAAGFTAEKGSNWVEFGGGWRMHVSPYGITCHSPKERAAFTIPLYD